jgi:hypothetical protein
MTVLKIDETKSVEEQYDQLLNLLPSEETDAARQSNPLGLPEGWFNVLSAGNEPRGLGFYCDRCKLHVVQNAPATVKHCGRVDARPEGFFQTMRLKTYKLARNIWG